MQQSREKQIKYFMLSYILLGIVIALRCYSSRVNSYNSTVLSFSYKYGFISRGLVGTIYQTLLPALKINPYCYESVLYFTFTVTCIFFVIYYDFSRKLLNRADNQMLKTQMLLLLFLGCYTSAMFFYRKNFGRLDIYMLLFSIIAVELIILDKFIFLTIPLCALGVMVHQGYVFMFYSMVFVLLCYRALTNKKKRGQYIACMVIGLVAVSILLFYFELFSHTDGSLFVDEIIKNAKAMGYNGLYHETLVQKEILGVDLTEVERDLHMMNFIEIPFYILFMLPYEIMLVKVFYRAIKVQTEKLYKYFYILAAIGSFAILPCIIMKVDYGRWIYTVIVYYIIIFTALTAMGEKCLTLELKKMIYKVKEKYSYASLILLYPMLFIPFWDVHIDQLLGNISNTINEHWLFIW